jgi:hypothetical protein
MTGITMDKSSMSEAKEIFITGYKELNNFISKYLFVYYG